MMRLNKFLSQCGLGSRRKCDHLILSGRIKVNDEVLTTLGSVIDENKDKISYNGKIVSRNSELVYIVLNKPSGYVTSLNDEWGRKIVTDLIPIEKRIFPVGRLDKETEGVILLTNDGDLCHTLTHPKFLVDKVYEVTLNKEITPQDISKLERGIMIESGVTAPCKIKLPVKNNKRILNMVIHEGKKRQVRYMFKALGYSVRRLIRIKFANIKINNIQRGKWRFLTNEEIIELKKISINPSKINVKEVT